MKRTNLHDTRTDAILKRMNVNKEALIEIVVAVFFLVFLFSGTVYAYVAGPIPFVQ